MSVLVETFLLTFSGLFSIVNPFGAALIFSQVTPDRTHAERADLARRIAVYSAIIMLVALWGGAYVLGFFGITVPALRIAGGLVVAASAWSLLFHNERHQETKQQQASSAEGDDDAIAFFPLTMPFTAGPGTIATVLVLATEAAGDPRRVGVLIAILACIYLISWPILHTGDRLIARIGEGKMSIITRVLGIILAALAVQYVFNGFTGYYESLVNR